MSAEPEVVVEAFFSLFGISFGFFDIVLLAALGGAAIYWFKIRSGSDSSKNDFPIYSIQ
jgi:hypothetical protein